MGSWFSTSLKDINKKGTYFSLLPPDVFKYVTDLQETKMCYHCYKELPLSELQYIELYSMNRDLSFYMCHSCINRPG